MRSLGASGCAIISACPGTAGTVATRKRSPSVVTSVRTDERLVPAATSSSGRPMVKWGVSSPAIPWPSAVMKMIRTSAAPSTHGGMPCAVAFWRSVKLTALCARLSSDWSSELISCWRITTYAVSARIAIDTPSAKVVSTATRDARERR